jgi:SAM-dependent methyltransferase
MCDEAALRFVIDNLVKHEVRSKSVLEVGARVVQRELSFRQFVEDLGPSRYLGVDIERGAGVDEICDAEDLRRRFGDQSFDVLISTELVEHVRDWRLVISNFKHVLRPGGVVLVTTRSRGFSYHGYPDDHWRYEVEDMTIIFSDFEIKTVQPDPTTPGVFVKAVKPAAFREADLQGYKLFSVKSHRRVDSVSGRAERIFDIAYAPTRVIKRLVPFPLKAWFKQTSFSANERARRRAMTNRTSGPGKKLR